ncbi:MAG TPA: DUF3237 domain-containing protein [Solirubrobacteraceae bacterium]|nr:DUF3237 domain-containing protein [Solirubrobacteraceae bacterium]
MGAELPAPRLRHVFRIDASLGDPIDLGPGPDGRQRIVPIAGGRVEGDALSGEVLPGGSADWQTVHPDGSSEGEIRMTLATPAGATVTLAARGLRHGPAEVLERLGRGEPAGADEYTFRAWVNLSSSAPELAWLGRGIFIAVGGRQPAGVAYDVYLVE